jgi:cell division protein FtsB
VTRIRLVFLPDSWVVSEARTTTLIRKPRRAASDVGRSRLGDLTRPIAREQRITKNRRPALLLGGVGLVLAVAIGAALFGLPVRTWFAQNDEIGRLERQLDELRDVNQELQQEVDILQTPEGITAAARETLGYIQGNERRQTIVGLPALPRDLPDGWPYGPLERIMDLRSAAAAEPGGS